MLQTVPTYNQIGIWGALILLLPLLRAIQGIGLGDEWSGTDKNRGFLASWPQFGAPRVGEPGAAMSGDQFLACGWPIPFLLSIIMIGIGLYARLGILETPVFTKLLAEERIVRTPSLEVFKRQPKEIFLTVFARMAEQGPGYIYGRSSSHMWPMCWGLLATCCWPPCLDSGLPVGPAVAGYLSDKIGRIMVCGLISITATALLKDHTNKDLMQAYDHI